MSVDHANLFPLVEGDGPLFGIVQSCWKSWVVFWHLLEFVFESLREVRLNDLGSALSSTVTRGLDGRLT